jgi:hypothetical protein
MEKRFIVESKTFVFSILDGALRLRVGEKRRTFSGEIVVNSQCSEWLALTMENLLDCPEDQEFIKSFREGSKIVFTRRGSNQAGRFLEVAVFGMGGRKWFILILEGRGGWGWIKFSVEMRKASTFLSAIIDSSSGPPTGLVKNEGKKEEPKLGLAPYWKGPSFVEVLRSGSSSIVRGSRSRLFHVSAKPCDLDLLSSVRQAEEELKTAVDCFSLEAPQPVLMGIDRPFCPPGKKSLAHPNLNFKISKRRTWSKLVIGSNLSLGRAVRKLLARFVGTSLGHRSGFRLARLFPKLILSRPLSILPEISPEISSGSPLDRLSTGVLVDVQLETSESVGMASSGSPGCLL